MRKTTKRVSIAIIALTALSLLALPHQARSATSDMLTLPTEPYGCQTGQSTHNALMENPLAGHLISVSEQSISASPGQTVSASVTYQAFAQTVPNNYDEIDQLFFVESWTTSWPPQGYTIPLYNGIPGVYPGVTETKTISFTVPSVSGTYYLWLCFEAQYSMQDAVNQRTQSMNGLPGHIKVVVSSSNPTSTEIPYWAWMALATSVVLAITTAAFASATFYFHKKAATPRQSVTPVKSPSKRDSRVCPNCGANLPADSKFCGKCGTSLE